MNLTTSHFLVRFALLWAVATSLFAADVASPPSTLLDVRSFGATGDGVTDDSAAVQAALDAVPVSGGTVVFPNGQYKLRSLKPKANTTIHASDGAILMPFRGVPNTLFNFYNGIVNSTVLKAAIAGSTRITVESTASLAVGHRIIVSGGTFKGSGVEEGPIEFNTVTRVDDEMSLTVETPLRYSYSEFGLPNASPRVETLGPAAEIVRNLHVTGGTYRPYTGFNSVYLLFHNVENIEIDHIHFDGAGSSLATGHNVAHLNFHDNVYNGKGA